jgi:hypothetical protein
MGTEFSTETHKLSLDLLPHDIQCEIGKDILSEFNLDKLYNYKNSIPVYQNPRVKFVFSEASYSVYTSPKKWVGTKTDSSESIYEWTYSQTYTFHKHNIVIESILVCNNEYGNSQHIYIYEKNIKCGYIRHCQLENKFITISNNGKVFAMCHEVDTGLFVRNPVYRIEIYSIMGKILYRKKIPTRATSLMFSRNDEYLAVQLSDGKHLCLRFEKSRIPFNINWRQAMYIYYILHGEKKFANYFRKDYLQLPFEFRNYVSMHFTPPDTFLESIEKALLDFKQV